MIDALEAAIRASEWSAAVPIALELWRQHRSPELADLIDGLAAKLPVTPPAKAGELHAWWMQRADPYDALATGALVASANTRLKQSDRDQSPEIPHGRIGARELGAALQLITAVVIGQIEHANAIERLAAILAWPDDPRAATILVDWLETMPVRWDAFSSGRANQHFYNAIADRLKALRDVRLLARLSECEQTPRGPTITLRQHQRVLARQIREATETVKPPKALATQVAALAALLPTSTVATRARDVDEDSLWRACTHDDPAPRLVLADYLAERGDPRGELITLQLAATPKAIAQANKLVRAQWNTWFGDLALVLNKSGTEFKDGMLDIARVGTPKSPEWAFTKVHGHRELATVRVVRPGHVLPQNYARFLAGPNLSPHTIAIDAPEILDHLLRIRAEWPFRVVEYGHYAVRNPYRYEFPPIAITFTRLAAMFPALEELRLDPLQWPQDAYTQVVAALPRLAACRSLKKIVVPTSWLLADDGELAKFARVTDA